MLCRRSWSPSTTPKRERSGSITSWRLTWVLRTEIDCSRPESSLTTWRSFVDWLMVPTCLSTSCSWICCRRSSATSFPRSFVSLPLLTVLIISWRPLITPLSCITRMDPVWLTLTAPLSSRRDFTLVGFPFSRISLSLDGKLVSNYTAFTYAAQIPTAGKFVENGWLIVF